MTEPITTILVFVLLPILMVQAALMIIVFLKLISSHLHTIVHQQVALIVFVSVLFLVIVLILAHKHAGQIHRLIIVLLLQLPLQQLQPPLHQQQSHHFLAAMSFANSKVIRVHGVLIMELSLIWSMDGFASTLINADIV